MSELSTASPSEIKPKTSLFFKLSMVFFLIFFSFAIAVMNPFSITQKTGDIYCGWRGKDYYDLRWGGCADHLYAGNMEEDYSKIKDHRSNHGSNKS